MPPLIGRRFAGVAPNYPQGVAHRFPHRRVVLAEFLDPRRGATGGKRPVENVIGRLDTLLGLQQFEKVHGAQLDDFLALPHDDATGHGRFLA